MDDEARQQLIRIQWRLEQMGLKKVPTDRPELDALGLVEYEELWEWAYDRLGPWPEMTAWRWWTARALWKLHELGLAVSNRLLLPHYWSVRPSGAFWPLRRFLMNASLRPGYWLGDVFERAYQKVSGVGVEGDAVRAEMARMLREREAS